jgi:NitT/TauT family transport system substrate-binding protein
MKAGSVKIIRDLRWQGKFPGIPAGLIPVMMDTVWPQNRFGLSLDQSLVLAMEDEARWTIANNMTNATAMPDFGKYIYTESLAKVRPGSINII